MTSLRFLVVLILVVSLSGCIFRKNAPSVTLPPPPKPAATAAAKPEGPLSIPQTTVQLPPQQPLDPAALEIEPPVPPEPAETVPPAKPARRPPLVATPVPKPPETATPPPQPAAEERPRLQEIISAEERKRVMDEIGNRKKEINDAIEIASRRNLSAQDKTMIDRIHSFVELSDQAAVQGDMRKADALSERALVLARELKGAR